MVTQQERGLRKNQRGCCSWAFLLGKELLQEAGPSQVTPAARAWAHHSYHPMPEWFTSGESCS